MIKIKQPRAGFILLAVTLHFVVASFIMYSATFNALRLLSDKWVIALMIIAIWSIVALLVNSLISGDRPLFADALYIIAMFALVIAFIKFLTPCLSPIGIYFTVHNMGDVEANAIGVPRSIAGIVLFVLTFILLIVSAFFMRTKKEYVEVKECEKQADGESGQVVEEVNNG